MKIWKITDIHLGVYNNSKIWQDISEKYFDDFFFPLIDKHKTEEDILICLGDVFDNRCNLQLQIQHLGISIFERLSEKFKEVHIIAGNHDVFFKTNNDVCSLDCLKYISNIYIYKTPTVLKRGNANMLLMPWMPSHHAEKALIDSIKDCNYLYCHTDIAGLLFNRNTKVEVGTDVEYLSTRFDKVFSGHIHYRQESKNVYMLGSPYQMDRNDVGNEKGIYAMDSDSGKLEFYQNDISPKFKSFYFDTIKEFGKKEIIKEVSNNFVDVFIESDAKYDDKEIKKFVSEYGKHCKKISLKYINKEDKKLIESKESGIKELDVKKISFSAINSHQYPQNIQKEKVVNYLENLFNKHTTNI